MSNDSLPVAPKFASCAYSEPHVWISAGRSFRQALTLSVSALALLASLTDVYAQATDASAYTSDATTPAVLTALSGGTKTFTGLFTLDTGATLQFTGGDSASTIILSPLYAPVLTGFGYNFDLSGLNGGTVRFGNHADVIANFGGALTIGGNSTLDLDGNSAKFTSGAIGVGSRIMSATSSDLYTTGTFNLDGQLDGAIRLRHLGGSILTISDLSTQANTYSGGTMIGGTVLARRVGALGTGDVTILTGGRLRSDRTTGLTVASQAHVEIGSGARWELSGPERIASIGGGGTLQVMSAAGALTIGGTNRDSVFSGEVLTSNVGGKIEKVGTGRLTFNGIGKVFYGDIDVRGGALEVNGDFGQTEQVLVSAGGTLAGVGTLQDVRVEAGAVVSPGRNGGSDIGTLSVVDLSFRPGSTFRVGINSVGSTDLLNVTGGSTDLGGAKVALEPKAGSYAANTQYTILRTAVASHFGASRFDPAVMTSTAFAFVAPELSYKSDNTEVYLTLKGKGEGGEIPKFSSVATNPTQTATGDAASALGASSPVYQALATTTVEGARQALTVLSGDTNTATTGTVSAGVGMVQSTVMSRMGGGGGPVGAPQAVAALVTAPADYAADRPAAKGVAVVPAAPRRGYSVWGQAFGGRGFQDAERDFPSLSRSTGGLMFGVDTGFDGRWRVGFAGSWSRTSFQVPTRYASGDTDTYAGTLYGSMQFGAASLRGGLSYAHHEIDNQRGIIFPGYAGHVSASHSGGTALAFAELAYGLRFGAVAFEPFAGVSHSSTRIDAFREIGDAAALVGQATRSDVTTTSLGLRSSVTFGALTARAGVSWRHAFGDVSTAGVYAFAANPAVPFTVAGAPIARDTFAVETGLDWAVTQSISLGLGYDGQFARGAREHQVKGELRVSF